MYPMHKDVVLPIGLVVDLDRPDQPLARHVRLRMPTVADEMLAERDRRNLLNSPVKQDQEFAELPGAQDVLFLARLVVSWQGVQMATWREVYRLARPDYNTLMDAVTSMEIGARRQVAQAEEAGEVAPLSAAAPASSP